MEKSFDFGALLRHNEKKHKSKPKQFVSVAGGVQKRLESNIKNRRSSRLTFFDRIRELPRSESPDPVLEAQVKVDHRKMQLQKWKAEKEQKKKEAAAMKKKPFIAGIAHIPLNFVLPPPVPSTSGRVTRSQTLKNSIKSFAPRNASFQPPNLKNPIKLPSALSKTKKNINNTLVFNPVLPNTTKQTRSRTVVNRQTATETKSNAHKATVANKNVSTVKGKVGKKPSPKTYNVNKIVAHSSSSSSNVVAKNMNIVNRIKTPGPGQRIEKAFKTTPRVLALSSDETSGSSPEQSATNNTVPSSSSSSDVEQSNVNIIKKALAKESKTTPKKLASSTEKKTSDSSNRKKSTTKSRKSSSSTTSSASLSSEISNVASTSSEQNTVVKSTIRKSMPLDLSPVVVDRPLQDSGENYSTPNKSLNKGSVPKSESGSEEKLRSPKSPIELALTPEQMEMAKISPCVTLSRGKANARKEMMWKIDEGLLDYDTSDLEKIGHFRRQLASEIERITGLCETWEKVSEQTVLPETVQGALLAAVGQARLLMTKKMQQFAALVERCARPDPASLLVTPADLHAFWDMLFMQVENIDMRFKKLEELYARNGAEDKPVADKQEKRRVPRPPPAAAAAERPKPAANSRIRDMIAAARKARKEQDSSATTSSNTSEPATSSEAQSSTKTFEAGFFSVRSPVRSPAAGTPSTPARSSLLKAVLSSEAKKASSSRNSASFAMLRASVLAKNAEFDGIAPLQLTPQMTPINLYATPGRSILKSSNDKTVKSIKKLVLFTESDNDIESSFYQSDPGTEERESTEEPIPQTEAIEQLDLQTDSNVSEMDVDKNTEQTDKENDPRPKLVRQDAVKSPQYETIVRTRRQRKSMQTPKEIESTEKTEEKTQATPKEPETEAKTPRRSTRKKKSLPATEELKEKTTKRSTRNKSLKEVETNVMEENKPTTKRSNRRRKSAPILDVST